MFHVPLPYLPSRFVPYPELKDTSERGVYVRKLTWGEVDYLYETTRTPKVIIDFYRDREIIKGIDLYRLTADDWSFLELQCVAMTWPDSEFRVHGGDCPSCGKGKVERIELGKDPLTGKDKVIEIHPELNKILVPTDISFHQLDDDVDYPIHIKAVDGSLIPADFYRIKDYLDLYESGNHRKKTFIIEKMIGKSILDIDMDDKPQLEFLYRKLKHGPLKSIEVKCPVCRNDYKLLTEWDVSRFIPFREDYRPEGNRILFGASEPPTSPVAPKSRLSSRPELVQ